MGRCSYTWREFVIKKGDIERHCQKHTWKDSKQYCIFHDPSPDKDFELFEQEIGEQFVNKDYNFKGYYFPVNWSFQNMIFDKDADFTGTTFQNVYFGRTTFQGRVFFKETKFQGNVFFRKATFQNADFDYATFHKDADFTRATFQGFADFGQATFQCTAGFSNVIFKNAYFCKTTFQKTRFIGATFQNADFTRATFQNANFNGATFQNANFNGATFQGDADFSYITVKEFFEFNPKEVCGITDFLRAKFFFRGVVNMDLERAKFNGAHLQNVAFVSCTWPRCKGLFGPYTCIYEEKHMKDKEINLSFKELETIYRDLKQTMQNHGDHDTAGEFYYREMEMRRKGAKTKKSRIWLELYRVLAGYGEKPLRVIGNSFFVIMLMAVLFFFSGITRVGTDISPEENPYIDYSLDSLTFNMTTVKDFGYCLYYSVVTFTTLGYGDIHPRGYSHILASAEALTGAFFMALFVVVFARKMMR